jgi:protein TonB
VRTLPGWYVYPTGEQIAWVYPDRANRLGVRGFASLHCTVLPTGQATDCSVANEDPVNQGFGAAAVRLSGWFRLRPMTIDGQAVAAPAVVPVRFAVGAD